MQIMGTEVEKNTINNIGNLDNKDANQKGLERSVKQKAKTKLQIQTEPHMAPKLIKELKRKQKDLTRW